MNVLNNEKSIFQCPNHAKGLFYSPVDKSDLYRVANVPQENVGITHFCSLRALSRISRIADEGPQFS